MPNFRTVEIDNVEVDLYQIMLLKNAGERIRTPYDRMSVSMTGSLESLQDKGLVKIVRGFHFQVTPFGKEWLQKYERTKQGEV